MMQCRTDQAVFWILDTVYFRFFSSSASTVEEGNLTNEIQPIVLYCFLADLFALFQCELASRHQITLKISNGLLYDFHTRLGAYTCSYVRSRSDRRRTVRGTVAVVFVG
jgi:hypothetical protein